MYTIHTLVKNKRSQIWEEIGYDTPGDIGGEYERTDQNTVLINEILKRHTLKYSVTHYKDSDIIKNWQWA